jgi:hypothetical protein
MNRRCMTLLVVAVAGATSLSVVDARQAPNLADTVAQYYPQALIDEALEIRGAQPNRKQCFGVLEASASGAPQIVVAGYTNMMSGAIRLLRAAGSGFEIAGEANAADLAGWECKVEALELDGDSRKEAAL